MKVYMGVSYTSQTCNKTFITNGHLKIYERTHSNVSHYLTSDLKFSQSVLVVLHRPPVLHIIWSHLYPAEVFCVRIWMTTYYETLHGCLFKHVFLLHISNFTPTFNFYCSIMKLYNTITILDYNSITILKRIHSIITSSGWPWICLTYWICFLFIMIMFQHSYIMHWISYNYMLMWLSFVLSWNEWPKFQQHGTT